MDLDEWEQNSGREAEIEIRANVETLQAETAAHIRAEQQRTANAEEAS